MIVAEWKSDTFADLLCPFGLHPTAPVSLPEEEDGDDREEFLRELRCVNPCIKPHLPGSWMGCPPCLSECDYLEAEDGVFWPDSIAVEFDYPGTPLDGVHAVQWYNLDCVSGEYWGVVGDNDYLLQIMLSKCRNPVDAYCRRTVNVRVYEYWPWYPSLPQAPIHKHYNGHLNGAASTTPWLDWPLSITVWEHA